MNDLADQTERVRAIGDKPPNAHTRAEIERALKSKWEGVQSVAAQVLGSWADTESKWRLRSFLSECTARRNGWSIRGVVVWALVNCVAEEDTDWILDLYFAANNIVDQHELFPLAKTVCSQKARNTLVNAAKSESEVVRFGAAKLIANLNYHDRKTLLTVFLNDASPRVKSVAQLHLKNAT